MGSHILDGISVLIEGSLEVKFPTIWTDEKQRWEESEKRREEKKREDQRRERVRRKKIQVCEKVGKSRNTVLFQFASAKVKNTSRSDHFWKLSCRKSARCCGAKHISKSKCTRHTVLGPLLDVQIAHLVKSEQTVKVL